MKQFKLIFKEMWKEFKESLDAFLNKPVITQRQTYFSEMQAQIRHIHIKEVYDKHDLLKLEELIYKCF